MTIKAAQSIELGISQHDNNYTLLRLALSISVIYYHSFGLVHNQGFSDHVTALLQPITTVGGLAVQLFFFLSGLFVCQSYYRDQDLVSFTIKRLFRLWPALFVCSFTSIVIGSILTTENSFSQILTAHSTYKYTFNTSVFDFEWEVEGVFKENASQVINGAIHTLPLEAKMYALLALFGAYGLLRKKTSIAITAMIMMLVCLSPSILKALPLDLANAEYTKTAICMFFGGVVTFSISHLITPRIIQGVLIFLMMTVATGTFKVVLFYLFSAWATIYFAQASIFRLIPKPKTDLSYGVYLYGWPIEQFCIHLFPALNPYELTFISVIVALCFAAASWRLVEEPFIKLGKNFKKTHWAKLSTRQFFSNYWHIYIFFTLIITTAVLFELSRKDYFKRVELFDAQISAYGPELIETGKSFNRQANGSSAIWIKLKQPARENMTIAIDSKKIETVVSGDVLTAIIPQHFVNKPGILSLTLNYSNSEVVFKSNPIIIPVTK